MLLCIITCIITGCSGDITSASPTDNSVSMLSSTQPTDSVSESASEQNASTDTTSLTQSSNDISSTSSSNSEPSESIENKETYANCRLIVNGKDITDGNYVYLYETDREFSSDADIPLSAILRELGATVEWQDETKVVITHSAYNGSLTFDTSDEFFGVLIPPGGKVRVTRKVYNNEIVMDNSSATLYIRAAGAMVRYDYTNMVIEVYETTEPSPIKIQGKIQGTKIQRDGSVS